MQTVTPLLSYLGYSIAQKYPSRKVLLLQVIPCWTKPAALSRVMESILSSKYTIKMSCHVLSYRLWFVGGSSCLCWDPNQLQVVRVGGGSARCLLRRLHWTTRRKAKCHLLATLFLGTFCSWFSSSLPFHTRTVHFAVIVMMICSDNWFCDDQVCGVPKLCGRINRVWVFWGEQIALESKCSKQRQLVHCFHVRWQTTRRRDGFVMVRRMIYVHSSTLSTIVSQIQIRGGNHPNVWFW